MFELKTGRWIRVNCNLIILAALKAGIFYILIATLIGNYNLHSIFQKDQQIQN